jgi:hypothetical protein
MSTGWAPKMRRIGDAFKTITGILGDRVHNRQEKAKGEVGQ